LHSMMILSYNPMDKITFSQKLILFLVRNGVVWVYLTYLLAFLGKAQIAEALAKTIVVQLLVTTLIYALKSLFENLSKNNSWPDKPKEEEKSPI